MNRVAKCKISTNSETNFYLDGEDKLHEQRVAKCEISTNSETNFYLDEVDKLDERGEQGENVEKSEVKSLPPRAQRPAYISQLPIRI